MLPVSFDGATEIKKPESMTDEQCMSIWAKRGFSTIIAYIEAHGFGIPHIYMDTDVEGFDFYLTAWKPSFEDLQAINRGEPIYIKTISQGLPPMAVFTLDENNEVN